jgi:hypothetical protein
VVIEVPQLLFLDEYDMDHPGYPVHERNSAPIETYGKSACS